MDAFIELDRVEKVFDVRRKTGFLKREVRQVRAVDAISFTVARGEMVGYIGPNGAGKSTTIKMLTGILVPSGGRLRVAGIDPSRERTRLAHRIGVVFGQHYHETCGGRSPVYPCRWASGRVLDGPESAGQTRCGVAVGIPTRSQWQRASEPQEGPPIYADDLARNDADLLGKGLPKIL